MSTFHAFLDERSETFDLSQIISKAVDEYDRTSPPSYVYKYFPPNLKQFFDRPSFRFTQRSSLNDPFELTRRWEQFGSAATRKLFSEHLQSTMRDLWARKDIQIELLKHEAQKRGVFPSDDQLRMLKRALRTKEGKAQVRHILEQAEASVAQYVDLMFEGADRGMDRFLDGFALAHGIFSVSDTPENQQLWGLYAASGSGFAVEMDTSSYFLGHLMAGAYCVK